MKKLSDLSFVRMVLALVAAFGLVELTGAADRKEAHVSEVIRDVRLLVARSGSRPAALNDPVRAGQAVRTGAGSRAELTFPDSTITRLGENSIFSYGQDAKEFDLSNGAALIAVPKESGPVRINTAATTASVTGFVALVESHAKGVNKFMVIEGEACVQRRFHRIPGDPCVTLHAGEMLITLPGTRGNGSVHAFDIEKTVKSALLLEDYWKLPKWVQNDIQTSIDSQNGGNPPGGPRHDPSGYDAVDQKNAASAPTPVPQPRPTSTPKRSDGRSKGRP